MKRMVWLMVIAALLIGIFPMQAQAVDLNVAGKSALLMDVATGSLRGMGSSVAPMIISILGVCGLRLLWIFTIFQIPQFHTPQCLYFSYTISWSATFLIEFVSFLVLLKKKKRLTAAA